MPALMNGLRGGFDNVINQLNKMNFDIKAVAKEDFKCLQFPDG